MRSTIELLLDLVRQKTQLVRLELSLVRAELSECGSLIATSLTALSVGLVLLLAGLGLILVALQLRLRLAFQLILRFFIVGFRGDRRGLAVEHGRAALRRKPSRLVPARSVSQISSLLEGL